MDSVLRAPSSSGVSVRILSVWFYNALINNAVAEQSTHCHASTRRGYFTLLTLRESPDASAVAMMVLDRKRTPLHRCTQGCAVCLQHNLFMMVTKDTAKWSRRLHVAAARLSTSV